MVSETNSTMICIVIGLAFVWAGLSLGGNLIAALAKFQVADLTLPVALQVGRAQFTWLGNAEWVLLLLLVAGSVFLKQRLTLLYLLPAGLFMIQQLALMPLLNQRIDIIISGSLPPEGKLHLIFILLELSKFAALIAILFLILNNTLSGQSNVE